MVCKPPRVSGLHFPGNRHLPALFETRWPEVSSVPFEFEVKLQEELRELALGAALLFEGRVRAPLCKQAAEAGCFAPLLLGKAPFPSLSRHCFELPFPVPASCSSQEGFCPLNPHKHGKNNNYKQSAL